MEMNATTLIDTLYGTHTYDEYDEWCENNGYDLKGENSEDFYNYLNDVREWDIEDFFIGLKYMGDKPYILIGSVRKWYGSLKIEPIYFNSVYDAVKRVTDNYGDYRVDFMENDEYGYYTITGYDHDGNSSFDVYTIKDTAKETIEKQIEEENDGCISVGSNGVVIADYDESWIEKIKR